MQKIRIPKEERREVLALLRAMYATDRPEPQQAPPPRPQLVRKAAAA